MLMHIYTYLKCYGKISYCNGEVANIHMLITLPFKIINKKVITYHYPLIPTMSKHPVKSVLMWSSCFGVTE